MHFVKAKHLLSNHNGLNIYRGCSHGCIYCDSRSKCYQMQHEFTDIEVKENAIELLREELKHKRKKIIVSTGSMSDPYLHLERKLEMTRKMLEVIDEYRHGVDILTKSALVLRDLDLLKQINQHSKVIVSMTITTADDVLCQKIEPFVSLTSQRVATLNILHKEGIATGVWLGPILPFINDTMENLQWILNACKEAHVAYIMCFGFGVTLREGDREYFYEQLDKEFPGLKAKYIQKYGLKYEVNSPRNQELYQYFVDFCIKNHIIYKVDEAFALLHQYESHEKKQYEQLSLFN